MPTHPLPKKPALTKSVVAKLATLLAIGLLALGSCADSAPNAGSGEPPLDGGPGFDDEGSPGGPIPIEGIDGSWTFLDGTDESGALAVDTTVTLIISGDSITGQSTCNSYSGTLDGQPTDLVVTDLIHTERACVTSSLNTFEDRYFSALEQVTVAIPTGGSLVLQGDGVSMNFLPMNSLPEG